MTDNNLDPEIAAISAVYTALQNLEKAAQRRVLDYVVQKLELKELSKAAPDRLAVQDTETNSTEGQSRLVEDHAPIEVDGEDGISPVAQRWIRRAGLSTDDLGKIFSIGGEEIDLIAQSVPGESKKDKIRSVLLLKAMASYLASGAARAAHTDVREAAIHYHAWDTANFANYLRSFASEIGGSKSAGYALNARGMSSATELIKTMVSQ